MSARAHIATRSARAGGLALAAALAGCAAAPEPIEPPPSGDVGLALLVPEGAARYEMPADTVFHLPLLDDAAPMPAWPAAWLRVDAPPRSVCAEVVIEADGRVRSVAPLGYRLRFRADRAGAGLEAL